MTPRRAFSFFFCLLVALAIPSFAADLDGFQPPRGKGDLAFSLSLDTYDHFWFGTDRRATPPALGKITNTTFSLWWRHGLTDRIALIAALPYVETEGDGSANFDESDLQDLEVLVQYRLFTHRGNGSGRHTVALGGGIRTPAANYRSDTPVSVGDESTDALLRVVYLFQWGRNYFSQQVGYDVRSDDPPNGLPLTTTIAHSFGRTTGSLIYQRYIATGGTDIGDPGFTFPSNKDEFERIWAKVFVRANEKFGVSLAGYGTLNGRNSGDSTGISVGVVWSY